MVFGSGATFNSMVSALKFFGRLGHKRGTKQESTTPKTSKLGKKKKKIELERGDLLD